MNKKNISFFEEIDLEVDSFLSTEILLDDRNIRLDLDLGELNPSKNLLDNYNRYANKLGEYKTKIGKAIAKDLKEDGTTMEYIEHLLEDLDEFTIEKLLVSTNSDKSKRERLFSTLKLDSIRINCSDEEFAIWYYTIGQDITNCNLEAYTDKEGKLLSLAYSIKYLCT